MGSSAFPALAINTQGESPLNTLAKVEQIKAAMQSQEMGSIQLQQARVNQQSQQILMEAYAKNGGDLNQTLADARASGKVTPNDLLGFQEKSVALQTAAAKLGETQLDNLTKEKEQVANSLEQFRSLPIEQRTPQAIAGVFKTLSDQNINPQKYLGNMQALAQNPSDDNIRQQELGLKGEQWVLANEKALREAASAPTVSQAQQKTQLELNKLASEAASAQRLFENLPSPLEAKTERQAKLAEENSTTAKNYVEIAKTKFDMFVKQNEPVAGTNQAGLREVTTRASANAKKLTQVTDLSNTEYDKLAMLSARFGSVAQNLGKYEAAIREAGPIEHRDDIAQVIADQGLGDEAGALHLIPSGKLVASKEVSKATADSWNKLTPAEQKLAMAYLQVKGGIITYNKAVDDTGRANEVAMHIEAANYPTPLEEKHIALDRLQGGKDNLKAILPAIPHFSNLKDPMEYLQQGEGVPMNTTQQVGRPGNALGAFGYQPPASQYPK